MSQAEIEYQLQHVVRISKSRPAELVIPIAGGSVGDRDDAAEFWELMKKGWLEIFVPSLQIVFGKFAKRCTLLGKAK